MARYVKKAAQQEWRADESVRKTVTEILDRIRAEGMEAVREYSKQFDDWSPESFRVPSDVALAAGDQLDPELREHIQFAHAQVKGFAEAQLETLSDLEIETLPGVTLGHRHVPVRAVGSYSPGGRYPMLASSIMTIAVPKVAGVKRVAATAPPRKGGAGIHPPQLYAMALSGADEIYCMGGVQAMAALALGAGEIEPVDMIVGAGNAFVAEAKRQLFGEVGIDLLAGPTEILVIAEAGSDAELVAADLLGQAEHGPTSPAIAVTDSEQLAAEILASVDELLKTWPTAEVAGQAWRDFGEVIVCSDREEIAEIADDYAPEHLEVMSKDPDWYLENLVNYGSLFLGEHSTVVYSDKAIGTNHVLPTSGAARYTGGLWVGKFLKTLTYQKVNAEGTRSVAPAADAISQAEHLLGHGLTASMRLERANRA